MGNNPTARERKLGRRKRTSVVVRQKAQYSLGKSKVVTERSDSVTTHLSYSDAIKLFRWPSFGSCSGAGIRASGCTHSPQLQPASRCCQLKNMQTILPDA